VVFNAGGGSNGSDLLLEVTHSPARHGEALYETLAGRQAAWGSTEAAAAGTAVAGSDRHLQVDH
jgi:hypothetical protein